MLQWLSGLMKDSGIASNWVKARKRTCTVFKRKLNLQGEFSKKKIWISSKKQAFDFFKTNPYTNAYKNSFVTRIDNVTYYLLISSKNLKAVYLSFPWYNDSWTGEFELITRKFELVTRGFEFATHGFELVTRGFELALLNFNSCF